jgi:hypothetical protein
MGTVAKETLTFSGASGMMIAQWTEQHFPAQINRFYFLLIVNRSGK